MYARTCAAIDSYIYVNISTSVSMASVRFFIICAYQFIFNFNTYLTKRKKKRRREKEEENNIFTNLVAILIRVCWVDNRNTNILNIFTPRLINFDCMLDSNHFEHVHETKNNDILKKHEKDLFCLRNK